MFFFLFLAWNVVFKIPMNKKPTGFSSIVAFWQASGSYNENDNSAKTDFSSSSNIYKSAWLDDWDVRSFSAVRLSAYKNNIEVAYIVFDSMGKTKNEWLDCADIIDSSYTDVASATRNYCEMTGSTSTLSRHFFVNNEYDGCPNDKGWFVLKDYNAQQGCAEWDVVTAQPYFLYSADSTKVTWSTAWDMVFKGVQGVVPPQGGLRQLWQGTDTLNNNNPSAQTLTRSPSLVYKSINVEKWQSVPGFFIESVKYAMFNNGKEVGFSIYDGRDTDKNGWFVDARILYSRWTDIKGYTKVGSSIDGDNIRRFALWKEHGGCPNDKAWMAILDSSDNGFHCTWDRLSTSHSISRPYFLYSNKRTWALCESGGAWNSAEFPTAETLAIFIKGWRMVMKVAHGQSVSPASGVYNLWTGTYTVNEFDSNALTISAGTKTYKSSVVDSWNNNHHISAVRIGFYKNGAEQAYVVFDAHGSDKNNWFDCNRILYTSFSDLNRNTGTSHCSVVGDSGHSRRFFLEKSYGGCGGDNGWFTVVEGTACAWEQKTSRPYFAYTSSGSSQVNDIMDNCNPNPCQNGGTCYDEGMDFTCTCSGSWIGERCADLNGGWSNWGSWAGCSATCGPGTWSRTRTCTNPSPVGAGSSCSGGSSQSTGCNLGVCIPDIDGGWGNWGSWSSCPVTCGTGQRTRTRNCDNPAQSGKGQDCQGPYSDALTCTLSPCAVDGAWGDWTAWTTCTKTCGTGKQVRSRACNNPAAAYGGVPCTGDTSQTLDCNTQGCPGCGTGMYLCTDGTCAIGGRCDGVTMCPDGSDEAGCSQAVLSLSLGYTNNNLQRPDPEEAGGTSMIGE
ncbi:hypothetical protein FSP39_013942 [Pinctada imbricata]|uniref:EGF-like domain-containing protein n=1 Tax=Pinctada imbricata TaxID=66713 RepID=A0AA88XEJ7_PINIB|nr:hypothetical protein FSP39_013942 [Pinctada imbricata]